MNLPMFHCQNRDPETGHTRTFTTDNVSLLAVWLKGKDLTRIKISVEIDSLPYEVDAIEDDLRAVQRLIAKINQSRR